MTVPLQAVTRETFWTISPVGKAVFYYLAATAILIFLYGTYQRFRRYARGIEDPIPRLDDLPARVLGAVREVGSNRPQFDRDRYAGVMHTFVVWGFLTLLVGTTILGVDIDLYRPLTGQSFFVGDFYLSYSLVMDALGLLFVVGVGMAIARRYANRDGRLWGPHTSLEDDAFVWTLFLLGVGGYVTEAVRIVGAGRPGFEQVSFVGYALADLLVTAGLDAAGAATLYWWAWWSHALLALGFVAMIPYAKPFHMLSSFANVVTRDAKAGARLPSVDADLDASTGVDDVDDFTWRELLDQDACTNCGRCSSVCPAKASGRNLDPRDVILDLKSYRESVDAGSEPVPIVADGGESVVAAESMDSCVACMACMDACPVEIEHLKSFTRLNRQLVETGDVDANLQGVFRDVMQKGNTFGEPQRTRADWAESLDEAPTDARETAVDYLWYVGDFPSFDERNQRVARALARLFDRADVDVGILYEDERYDGNDVRRVGEEFLYLELAGHHVETFADCEFDAIVCTDPHSFNTFRNEYPDLDLGEFADDPMMPFEYEGRWNEDGAIDVLHWTQVLADLVESGDLSVPETLDETVTFHDPCHLGRMNDVYEAPRTLVEATGCELVEMPRSHADSFCCGGGGGGVWTEVEEESKPSEERLREAVEDTAGAVERFVVACPMCTTMFEDGRKTGGFEEALDVVDVAELLEEAFEAA